MKNVVNRAPDVGAKKIKFSLLTLVLLFTMGIGQMWAAESATNNPATVEYGTGSAKKTFLNVANTVSNCTITSGSVACVTYGLYEMDKNWKPAFYSGPANGSSSSRDYSGASAVGFMAGSSAGSGTAANKSATSGYGSAKYTSSAEAVIYVTGITGIAVMGFDADTKSEKRLYVKVEEYAADGTCTAVGTGDGITKSSYSKSLHITTFDAGTLSGTKYYKVTLSSGNTSNCETSQIRFTKYIAPSCDDSNASIIENTAVYVDDELDLEFSSDNVNSVSYSIKKNNETTTDASVEDGVFKATVAGTYVVTATQAKDASNHCAVEESVTITVNPKTPVTSATIEGATSGFIGNAISYTATAAYATSYEWYVNDTKQSETSAEFEYTPAAKGNYNIYCKATNAHTTTPVQSNTIALSVTKVCGVLINFDNFQANTSSTPAAVTLSSPAKGVIGGTGHQKTRNGAENGGYRFSSNDMYLGLTLASGNTFKAGDKLKINVIAEGTKVVSLYSSLTGDMLQQETYTGTGEKEFTLNYKFDGATSVYMYRKTDANEGNGTFSSISVSRPCTESEDATLAFLKIAGEDVTPTANVYSYEASATEVATKVAVTYALNNGFATASPASGFEINIPTAGNPANTQTLTVTAEDGVHSNTYTINVSRAAGLSDDATLSAMSVTGYTLSPTFAAATEDYTITKAYGAEDPAADKVSVTPATGASADIQWDDTNKKFVITVTAEDDVTKKTYTITVNEAEAPKNLSRVLFSNGFDAFIDNTNHTVKAYYLAGTDVPTATTITAGAGTAGELAEGKITVTGADDSTVDYIVTLEAVTPNTSSVAEAAAAGEFAGNEAWVKNGLLIYGTAAGYSAGDKWYVNRRLKKDGDPADDQRVIAGWVRSYFFVGNASKFIMTVGGNNALKYAIDGGEQVANESGTLEIALTKGNHMIEIVSNQSNGDCRLSAPKLVELPPTFTVTYMPGDGTGAWVVDEEALVVADCPSGFTAPEGKIFHGWKDGDNNDVAVGDAVSANMALTAQWIAHYAVTFNMQDHGTAIVAQDIVHGSKAVKPDDPFEIGYDFGGWYTEAACTNAFDFNTAITAATELFAKWTAFDGCALFYPATSGETIAVGDAINKQTGSFGATMVAVSKDETCTLEYASYGLSFASSGNTSRVKVTLDHEIAIGTKITVTLVANGDPSNKDRALDLYNSAVSKKATLGWGSSDEYAKYDVATFSHVVTADDAMAGTNEFYLYRNNSVYLQCLKVESCGAAIVYHNVTSAVVPAGKGTVTLGANSVREGYTTTAEYTITDPLYEFVSWEVSGEGATLSSTTANPVTVTVGTADAVVTLNLQLIPVKYTVKYYDGETLKGTEEVNANEHPTASEINTNKRHFTFQGWSDTDGGEVVALNTITSAVAATINLYAVYEPVACPTEGTVFSMEFDNTKAPEETVVAPKNGGVVELADYATISGGDARIINNNSSNKDAISTDGKFLLKATDEVMKIELDCAIAAGDVIRIPDNSAKAVLSTSNAKTGTYATLADKNTHEFEATAAWNGVDDLYVLYDGSSLSFTKVYVLRPYTVSFDLQGHGDAIAAQKLVEGKKVTAPTAPTADGWDFVGWYKEAACTNAWNFNNDVVESTMSLFAKWTEHIYNDATLKSLKYGNTAIELEDGIYSYDVEVAYTATAVPALTAETNAALATKQITNATAFDGDGHASSTVLVTAEDGETQLTYTVNFSKAAAIEPANVTATRTWDWTTVGMGEIATASVSVEYLMVNVSNEVPNTEAFRSDMLFITGQYANRGSSNKFFQGWTIRFYTEVPGMVTITARAIHGTMSLTVNDATLTGLGTTMKKHKPFFVEAGWVTITMTNEATSGSDVGEACRLQKIEFQTADHTRSNVNPAYLGTLCWTNNAILGGAKLYELSGHDVHNYLVFDEVEGNVLEAGKPYIFMPENGSTEINLFNTDDAEPLTEDQAPVNHMYGTVEGKSLSPLTDTDMYYFSSNHIWRVGDFNSNVNIPAYYCYVDYNAVLNDEPAPAPAQGRRRITMGVNGTNTATGIENLKASDKPMKLMINGQIFILRGEKLFDATGRLVK